MLGTLAGCCGGKKLTTVLIPFFVNGGAPMAHLWQTLQVILTDWHETYGVFSRTVSHSRFNVDFFGVVGCFCLECIGCSCILGCVGFDLVVQHILYIDFVMNSVAMVPAGSKISAIIIGIFVTYSPTFSANEVSM